MKKLLALILALAPSLALAQNAGWPPPAGAIAFLGVYNTAPPTLTNGQVGFAQLDSTGHLLVSASVSATVTGFAPSLAYATCTATGSSCSSTALPTNTGSVILFNAGTTTVSCTLASGAATALASELQIPASSGLALATVYGATTYDHFACIDQSGSTSNVVIASGGSGLPTGWGGGGSGGGGVVTQPTASLLNMTEANSAAILSAIQGSIPAGSAIIGKVGVDQTTPGTTNGVALVGVNGATALAGNGVTGTGSPRVTIASDNTPFTVNAPDPCGGSATKVNVPISQTGNTKLISATTAKKNYICSIIFNASDAENVSIVEGTGSTCGTSTAAILGGTTAATGMHFAANGGMARGNGNSWVMGATGTAVDLCLFQSGSGTIAGNLTYVQQ